MWVNGDKTFFDVRLINWLTGRVGSATDQVTHEALCWVADEAAKKKVTTAIIDMQGLGGGQHHVYENFLDRFCVPHVKTRGIIFWNVVSEKVVNMIHQETRKNSAWVSRPGKDSVVLVRKDCKGINFADVGSAKLSKLNEDAIQASIVKAAQQCCVITDHLDPLPSSPVQTNVKFYCKKLLCSPIDCTPVVRDIAKYVQQFEAKSLGRLTLCASSVNGAILAGYVGSFLNRTCLVLNHLGPKDKLFEKRVLKFVQPGAPYLVIADYICLGTELRVVRSNIENQGGKYVGAVALGALSRGVTSHSSFGEVVALTYVTDIFKNVRARIPGLGG